MLKVYICSHFQDVKARNIVHILLLSVSPSSPLLLPVIEFNCIILDESDLESDSLIPINGKAFGSPGWYHRGGETIELGFFHPDQNGTLRRLFDLDQWKSLNEIAKSCITVSGAGIEDTEGVYYLEGQDINGHSIYNMEKGNIR